MKSPTEVTVQNGLRALITLSGDDPDRDGLLESPERFARAFLEMTSGYTENPDEILSKQFDQIFDEMIILRNIEFQSMCEHHFAPFIGHATIGYIPAEAGKRVVGISKLARLLDCFAHRLQIQERLTMQIADALERNLQPVGIGVIIRAKHLCVSCRGVRKAEPDMVTSVFRGALRDEHEARAEFLNLIQ